MNFIRHHSFITIKRLALTAVLAAFVGVAHASTITYNLDAGTATNWSGGTDPATGSVTGTVTIDTTTNLATAGDLTFNLAPLGDFEFTVDGSHYGGPGINSAEFDDLSNNTLYAHLYYDTSNIGIGDLNLIGNNWIYMAGTYYAFGGTLDPVSSTPEPSSLLLLGTGVLGLAGFARRRFLTA